MACIMSDHAAHDDIAIIMGGEFEGAIALQFLTHLSCHGISQARLEGFIGKRSDLDRFVPRSHTVGRPEFITRAARKTKYRPEGSSASKQKGLNGFAGPVEPCCARGRAHSYRQRGRSGRVSRDPN